MKYKEMIDKLTLEEKASLCSGKNFWLTKSVERLGIPSIRMSDGPYGLRKQNEGEDYLDFRAATKTVCFPTGSGMAASFNKELLYDFGSTLGKECKAEGIHVLLGPAFNIKRSPLGGRNFEYFSEDPLVSSLLAANYIKGLQDEGVAACAKHFVLNNQEYRRMMSSSEVDDRTFYELYLNNFEKAIKDAKPFSIMNSYNRVNGEFVSESKKIITDILRNKWGYEGAVITDWGAICDRNKGLEAGIDLEMPSSGGESDKKIVEAVKNGTLDEKYLDQAVERILDLIDRCYQEKEDVKPEVLNWDYEKDHKKSEEYARESMVLLKNETDILPLPNQGKKIAMIGDFAKNPRFQGGGSSHINCFKVETPWEASAKWSDITFQYAQGYFADGESTEELIAEAVRTAESCDYTIVFIGLPDSYEAESYDRKNMKLPPFHNRLVEEIARVQKKCIVVLQNGSPVEMPWIDRVPAVLEMYLAGEAAGAAVMDILFGEVNPSGHLAESFPLRLEDNPAYLNFPGYGNEVYYQEGIFVGYRYYTSKKMPVLFPFGYGLSYTEFTYTKMELDKQSMLDDETVTVTVTIKNTGSVVGKAVVQIYVKPFQATLEAPRPLRELKAFEKIEIKAGEEKTVEIMLDQSAFAFYDVNSDDYRVSTGNYVIEAAEHCDKVIVGKSLYIKSRNEKTVIINENVFIGDLLQLESTKEIMKQEVVKMLAFLGIVPVLNEAGEVKEEEIPRFVYELPLRTMIGYTDGAYSGVMLDELLSKLKNIHDKDAN